MDCPPDEEEDEGRLLLVAGVVSLFSELNPTMQHQALHAIQIISRSSECRRITCPHYRADCDRDRRCQCVMMYKFPEWEERKTARHWHEMEWPWRDKRRIIG